MPIGGGDLPLEHGLHLRVGFGRGAAVQVEHLLHQGHQVVVLGYVGGVGGVYCADGETIKMRRLDFRQCLALLGINDLVIPIHQPRIQ